MEEHELLSCIYSNVEQTFSNGYTVLVQAGHLSWVPQNRAESLLGVLGCKMTIHIRPKKFSRGYDNKDGVVLKKVAGFETCP